MAEGLRAVHFVNQFFGQIGGEEQAGVGPQQREGAVGPARAADAALKGRGQVVATVICGDNYIAEHTEEATKALLAMIREHRPDIVLAGPAFNAGRYGMACGALAVAIQRELGIPVITGMYKENPGVDVYRRDVLIVETGETAAQMAQVINKMVSLAERMAAGEQIRNAAAEGCFPRGIVVNEFAERNAGQRAVDMLVKKLRGEPYQTEVQVPQYPKIAAPAAVKDLRRARVAIVTDGGIVPKGNPDRIEGANATRWGGYSIEGMDTLDPSQYEVVHRGYDVRFVAEDPNRLIPVDTLRELEKQGAIGELHDVFFTTTGVGTTLENSRRMGAEIAKQLQDAGVDAVILTST